MTNIKTNVLLFGICILSLFCYLCFGICYLYAKEDSSIQKITQAKNNQEARAALEYLKNAYLKDAKFNEFIDILQPLIQQEKNLAPLLDYYIALTRYQQLKYLEETQSWDEYFAGGNNYREELTASAQKTLDATAAQDPLNIYTRLLLWQFHKDQQDTSVEQALSDLMTAAKVYAQDAKDTQVVKDAADKLLAYAEIGKAKELYRLYAEKLVNSKISNEELKNTAFDFYQKGNVELSENIYDSYVERLSKSITEEKIGPALIEIAKLFAYKDGAGNDPAYAERIFQKIEVLSGGKDSFNEELIYMRAFNLEKAKEYLLAQDKYLDLAKRYPGSKYADEALFKAGIISTYIVRDLKSGRGYFEKLAGKKSTAPQVISALYQLGLLYQWEENITGAKEYYAKLVERAGEDFSDTVTLAQERMKEIAEQKPIEYNLKTFLDASFKEEYSNLDTTKVDLKSNPYLIKKNESVDVHSTPYLSPSGCMQVEVEYLWSGHTGTANPAPDDSSFNTAYPDTGTKEINLVVVSPSGIIDRNLDMVDAR